ncbi:hypothetical protein BC830DRAFT_1153321, partial [Chytriomyces sp. MP71]
TQGVEVIVLKEQVIQQETQLHTQISKIGTHNAKIESLQQQVERQSAQLTIQHEKMVEQDLKISTQGELAARQTSQLAKQAVNIPQLMASNMNLTKKVYSLVQKEALTHSIKRQLEAADKANMVTTQAHQVTSQCAYVAKQAYMTASTWHNQVAIPTLQQQGTKIGVLEEDKRVLSWEVYFCDFKIQEQHHELSKMMTDAVVLLKDSTACPLNLLVKLCDIIHAYVVACGGYSL